MIDIRTKMIAALGLLLVLLGVVGAAHYCGEVVGRAAVQADWDRAKLGTAEATNRAVLAAVAANDIKHAKDLATTQKVLNEYETDLAARGAAVTAARADADRYRLRIPAPACRPAAPADAAAGPGVADGAGAATTIDLPGAIETGLYDLAEADDREIGRLTSKLSALQNWVREHGFYGPQP